MPADPADRRWSEHSATLAGALALIVLAGLAIAIVAAAHPSGLVPPSKGGFGDWMVGPFKGVASGLTRAHEALGSIFSALLVAMTAAYVVVLAGARRVPLSWAVAAIVAVQVVFMLCPPLVLTDVFNYFDYARLGVLHGFNPYTAVPADAGGDVTYHYATWHHLSSPYGSFFTLFTYALVPLDVHAGYWTLKALTLLASLGSLMLVWRVAERLGRPAVPAVLLVGLNPLLLVFGMGGVHTDFFIMLAVMAGILLILDRRPAGGAAFMMLATGVKATAGVLLPFALIGSHDRRAAVRGIAITGAVLVVASLLAFGPAIPSLGPQTTLVSPLGALNLLGLLLGFGGVTRGMQIASQMLLAGVLAYLIRRAWRGADWMDMGAWAVFALVLSLSWVVPWYVMWLLPLAAVSASRALHRAALGLTVLLLVTSLPATATILADGIGWYPDHTHLGKQHAKEIRRYLK